MSARTPTEMPGFHLLASHTMERVTWLPSSRMYVCGPTFSSSMSWVLNPITIPKCIGRRSIYGLFSTRRSCAVAIIVITANNSVIIAFFIVI